MQKLLIVIVIIGNIFLPSHTWAQEADGRFRAKEYSIPPSPVFDLMGISSSQMFRKSDSKEIKVD